MNYDEWGLFYKDILYEFDFSASEDIVAARILNSLVESLPMEVLEEMLAGKTACIYGSGETLEEVGDFPRCARIAADGATSYLLGKGVVPEVVVTDLDGKIEDLLEANRRGSIMVIHAHGDNISKIKNHAQRFTRVIPTCQCRPFGSLRNFGGFTDGDRAVFMAEHFKAKEIVLYGMDFGRVGKYSFTRNTPRKRKKLMWGKKLIDYLRQRGDVKITEG